MSKKIQMAIKATPEAVWTALTDGSITPAYYYGFAADFDLKKGGSYTYSAGGFDGITGTVLDVQNAEKLVTTFNGVYDPEVAALPESTVTFTLSVDELPLPGVTLLTIHHEGLTDGVGATKLQSGWVAIASGLKTLLETGAPLAPAPGA